jgi:hypothetical protein
MWWCNPPNNPSPIPPEVSKKSRTEFIPKSNYNSLLFNILWHIPKEFVILRISNRYERTHDGIEIRAQNSGGRR